MVNRIGAPGALHCNHASVRGTTLAGVQFTNVAAVIGGESFYADDADRMVLLGVHLR
jgi:hypothetical protein